MAKKKIEENVDIIDDIIEDVVDEIVSEEPKSNVVTDDIIVEDVTEDVVDDGFDYVELPRMYHGGLVKIIGKVRRFGLQVDKEAFRVAHVAKKLVSDGFAEYAELVKEKRIRKK